MLKNHFQKEEAAAKAVESVAKASAKRLGVQEKVIKIQKALSTAQSVKPPKGENDKLREVNGRFYAAWTTPCPQFMQKYDLMPQKQCPRRCYHDLR